MPTLGNRLLKSQGDFEPQRINNWVLAFRGLDLIGLAQDEFFLTLKSFPFPQEGNAKKVIRWWNESRFYAGSVEDFGSQSLVVRDYIDAQTAQLLTTWRRKVWNPTNLTVGLARDYKVDGMLYLARPNVVELGGDGMQNARSIYLQGCWPVNFTMGEFDMDNDGDNVMITVEISIDRAYAGDEGGDRDDSKLGPLQLSGTGI
jgi:hypothetical protein